MQLFTDGTRVKPRNDCRADVSNVPIWPSTVSLSHWTKIPLPTSIFQKLLSSPMAATFADPLLCTKEAISFIFTPSASRQGAALGSTAMVVMLLVIWVPFGGPDWTATPTWQPVVTLVGT